MTQLRPARVRTCPDCDGFPMVAITTGTLNADGTRATLRVTCRACSGTGTVPLPARVAVRAEGRA